MQGLGLVDHLQELCVAFQRPKLKALALPYNGLDAAQCEYFKHVINFETLEELNIGYNWFGCQGLHKFKSSFAKFTKLRKLNLNLSKLCTQGEDVRHFRDLLQAVATNITDLSISENNVKDCDMVDFLIPAISQMKNLKTFEISRNPVSKFGIVGLFNILL